MLMTRGAPAPAPFDHPEADIVLRSSDKEPLDFRTFKLLLALSSPFFSEIFTLPQPPTPSLNSVASPYADEYMSFDPVTLKHKRIPVIQMTEDKETLTLLLGLCLPTSIHPQPFISALDQLVKVAEAAFKFEMVEIQRHLREVLISQRFIESQPTRVFAIAYRYSWDLEARKAARYTLRHALNVPYVDELQYISAATFYKLQEYHRICGEVASSRVMLQPALAEHDDSWVWITCKRCPGSFEATTMRWSTLLNFTNTQTHPDSRKWWVQWIEEVAKELRARPWGETVRKWDAMSKAIDKASLCASCGPRVRRDLDTFAQMLAVEIERDISSVCIPFFAGKEMLDSVHYLGRLGDHF
jgi:hypothetical protein